MAAIGLGIAAVAALAAVLCRPDIRADGAGCFAMIRDRGALPFFLAMATLPAFGFPMAPFFVAAGFVFGPRLGFSALMVCSVAAVAADVALGYGLAAGALRPQIARLAAWLGYDLPVINAKNAWEVTLLVRLMPGLPFFIQSYLLGLAKAPFISYLIVSTLVPSLFLSSMILLGRGAARNNHGAIALGAVLVIAASVAMHRLRKRLIPTKAASA